MKNPLPITAALLDDFNKTGHLMQPEDRKRWLGKIKSIWLEEAENYSLAMEYICKNGLWTHAQIESLTTEGKS
jgi:hypothetical protein